MGWSPILNYLCRALGLVTLALLLAQCGNPPQQEQAASQAEQAPAPGAPSFPAVLRGHIIPALPSATSTLTIDLQAADPLGTPVTFRYQWKLEGRPIPGATGAQLPPGDFVRGQTVSVEVTPVAGGRTGPVWRALSVRIGNAAPRVRRVEVQPSPVSRREPVRAVVEVADPDGDAVTLSYQWLRNGAPIPGAIEATLAPSHFKRRDWLAVQVSATDGQDSTPPLRSGQVDVLPAAPRIVSQVAPTDFQGRRFRYQVQAVHPDGEPLRYSLSSDAPRGMRINAQTGLVEWEPNPSQTGSFDFQAIVEDSAGAKVEQPISLAIEGE